MIRKERMFFKLLPSTNKVKYIAGYGPRFLIAVPEFLEQFSRKQAQNAKTGSINSGTGLIHAEKTGFWDSALKTYLQVLITTMNQNDNNDNNYNKALPVP